MNPKVGILILGDQLSWHHPVLADADPRDVVVILAEVAEEKRSVFRALTRLRGVAVTSFDGIARAQTGQIDEYNKSHQWRRTLTIKKIKNISEMILLTIQYDFLVKNAV